MNYRCKTKDYYSYMWSVLSLNKPCMFQYHFLWNFLNVVNLQIYFSCLNVVWGWSVTQKFLAHLTAQNAKCTYYLIHEDTAPHRPCVYIYIFAHITWCFLVAGPPYKPSGLTWMRFKRSLMLLLIPEVRIWLFNIHWMRAYFKQAHILVLNTYKQRIERQIIEQQLRHFT